MVSAASIQCCDCNGETAMDNVETNERGPAPETLFTKPGGR